MDNLRYRFTCKCSLMQMWDKYMLFVYPATGKARGLQINESFAVMFKAVEDMESFGTDQLAASLTEHYGLAPVQAGQEAARTLELWIQEGLICRC